MDDVEPEMNAGISDEPVGMQPKTTVTVTEPGRMDMGEPAGMRPQSTAVSTLITRN